MHFDLIGFIHIIFKDIFVHAEEDSEYQKFNPIMQLWNLMSSETGNDLVSLTVIR